MEASLLSLAEKGPWPLPARGWRPPDSELLITHRRLFLRIFRPDSVLADRTEERSAGGAKGRRCLASERERECVRRVACMSLALAVPLSLFFSFFSRWCLSSAPSGRILSCGDIRPAGRHARCTTARSDGRGRPAEEEGREFVGPTMVALAEESDSFVCRPFPPSSFGISLRKAQSPTAAREVEALRVR